MLELFHPTPLDILSSGLQDVHTVVPAFFSFHFLQLTLGADTLVES